MDSAATSQQPYDLYRAAKTREKAAAKALRRQAKEKRDAAVTEAKLAYKREKKMVYFNRDRNLQQLLASFPAGGANQTAASAGTV